MPKPKIYRYIANQKKYVAIDPKCDEIEDGYVHDFVTSTKLPEPSAKFSPTIYQADGKITPRWWLLDRVENGATLYHKISLRFEQGRVFWQKAGNTARARVQVGGSLDPNLVTALAFSFQHERPNPIYLSKLASDFLDSFANQPPDAAYGLLQIFYRELAAQGKTLFTSVYAQRLQSEHNQAKHQIAKILNLHFDIQSACLAQMKPEAVHSPEQLNYFKNALSTLLGIFKAMDLVISSNEKQSVMLHNLFLNRRLKHSETFSALANRLVGYYDKLPANLKRDVILFFKNDIPFEFEEHTEKFRNANANFIDGLKRRKSTEDHYARILSSRSLISKLHSHDILRLIGCHDEIYGNIKAANFMYEHIRPRNLIARLIRKLSAWLSNKPYFPDLLSSADKTIITLLHETGQRLEQTRMSRNRDVLSTLALRRTASTPSLSCLETERLTTTSSPLFKLTSRSEQPRTEITADDLQHGFMINHETGEVKPQDLPKRHIPQ